MKHSLLLLLAALAPLGGSAQSVSSEKKVDVKVITGHYHAGHRINTRIANEKGWFREEGLGRVDIAPLGTNDDHLTLAELSKGRADIVWRRRERTGSRAFSTVNASIRSSRSVMTPRECGRR